MIDLQPSWPGVCLFHLPHFKGLRSGWITLKCVSMCTTVLFQTLRLSAPLLSRRPFSIPHDSNADVFGRGRRDSLEVCYRECLYVAGQNSRVWGWGSSCTWWQTVTGLIIRRLNLNPTCYITRITHYQDIDERSHAHGKIEKKICVPLCVVYLGLGR